MGTDRTVVVTNAIALAGSAYLELAPLRGLTGAGLGVQLWLRARQQAGRCRWIDLGGGPGGERLALIHDGDRNQLSLELSIAGDVITAVRGDLGLAPDRWIHVTASLAADGTAALSINGELLATSRVALPPDRLRPLLVAPILTRCLVGRQELAKKQPVYVGLDGALAELRVWSRPLAAGEREGWRTRARGDEPGLLVCHRLDDADAAVLLDHGPRRAHARGPGARPTDSADLPLRRAHDPAQAHLEVRARLVREHLPLTAFPADRALISGLAKGPDLRRVNADAFGEIDGDRVLCSLHEIFVEPRRGSATGVLEVRVDAAVLALVDGDGDGLVELVAWSPGRTHELPIPALGKLRLRLLADDSLDCPTVRLRWSALPADVWYAARPAELVHASLRLQTGDELLRPTSGKRSPLPPGTSPEDADALADLLVQVASGLSAPDEARADPLSFDLPTADEDDDDPALQSFGIGGWIKKAAGVVADAAEDAADDVADTAKDVARSASKLSKQASKFVVRGAKDTQALLAGAARVSPQFGRAAVRDCIRDAASLAVATARDGAAWRTISLVGARLVDGVEQYWRVVVSGVDDLLATIGAFFERIGASLRAMIDYLAALFDWGRFLRASDRIYDVARRSLARQAGALDGKLAAMFAEIENFAAAPLRTDLADQTLGQALGVRRGASVPVLHELDVMVDHMRRLFTSKHVKADGAGLARDPRVSADVAREAATATGALVPSAAMDSPTGILDLPLRPLLALPLQAWRLAAPVVEPVIADLVESGAAISRHGARLATARIDVPWLTNMIETTILRGRKLDLLRVVSLLAAIPSVLIEAGERLVSFGGDDVNDVPADLRWLLFSTSLVNSLIIVARAVVERDSKNKALGPLLVFNGVIAGIQAGANIALAETLRGSTAVYAKLACTMDCLSAVWYGFYGGLLIAFPVHAPLWAEFDQCVEITLGLVTLLLAVVAAADNQAADEQVQITLSFRITNWVTKAVQKIADGLDNNFPKAAIVSVASGVLLVALDLAEGAYYISPDVAALMDDIVDATARTATPAPEPSLVP